MNLTDRRKTPVNAVLISYLIAAAVFLLVPLIIIPAADRSAYYWPRLLWSQFLLFLVWFVSRRALLISTDKIKKDSGGFWPFLVMLVSAYALLSFCMMTIHAFLPANDSLDRLHLVMQIILTGSAAIISLIARFATSAGIAKINVPFAGGVSPRELAIALGAEMERLRIAARNTPSAEMKALAESLDYLQQRIELSIPQIQAFDDKSEYSEIAAKIVALNQRLSKVDYDSPDRNKLCNGIKAEVDNLLPSIGAFAKNLRR